MKEEKKIIIDCACGENRYLRFWKSENEKEWYVSFSYEKTSFRQKLRYIWRVIVHGENWDTIIVSEEDIKNLKSKL